jgi:hypothetical protein
MLIRKNTPIYNPTEINLDFGIQKENYIFEKEKGILLSGKMPYCKTHPYLLGRLRQCDFICCHILRQ